MHTCGALLFVGSLATGDTLWNFLVSELQPSVVIQPLKPFNPSCVCFLLFFKGTPSVTLSSLPLLSPQPDTRPRSAHAWLRSGVTSAKRSCLTIDHRCQRTCYLIRLFFCSGTYRYQIVFAF